MKYKLGDKIMVYATDIGTPLETLCMVLKVEKKRLQVVRLPTKTHSNPHAFWAHPKQCEKVVK